MIPLFKPYMPELPLLHEILHSGQLSYGQYVKEFEKALQKKFGTELLMVVNSYSSAIFVALKALGIKANDQVILSPMACLVSTQPYAAMGQKVKWCDIDNATGTLLPDALRQTIDADTKLIVHNHFCGYPGYIREVNDIAKEHGIPVMNDGIEAFGSIYNDALLGVDSGDVTVFSLSAVRPLNTIDGGILIFRDTSVYEKAKLVRDCGIDRTIFRDAMGEIDANCDIGIVGFSAMMSNVNAYIGLEQLKHIDEILARQRKQANIWSESFQEINKGTAVDSRDTLPNYWVYGILVENKRDCIMNFRNKGFYASGVHVDNSRYSLFGECDALRGVKDFNNRFVALPCGWWMHDES